MYSMRVPLLCLKKKKKRLDTEGQPAGSVILSSIELHPPEPNRNSFEMESNAVNLRGDRKRFHGSLASEGKTAINENHIQSQTIHHSVTADFKDIGVPLLVV